MTLFDQIMSHRMDLYEARMPAVEDYAVEVDDKPDDAECEVCRVDGHHFAALRQCRDCDSPICADHTTDGRCPECRELEEGNIQ